MKNVKRKSLMLGTLVLISVALIAQPNSSEKLPNAGAKKGTHKKMNQDGRRAQGDRMANYLELSDAQKTKMKALKLEQQKAMLPLKNEMGEKKAKMKSLRSDENADMKAINALIDDMAVTKTKMAKMQAAHHQEIRKILNEEQRIKFDSHRGHKGHDRGKRNQE